MNRIIALVVAIVIVLYAASSTVLTVDERHMAVLSPRGGGAPTLAGPGLHFRLPPPLQTVTLIDSRVQTLAADDQTRCTTADKTDVLVSPVLKYRVSDPLKLLSETKGDARSLPDRLALLVRGALSDAIARDPLDQVLAGQNTIAEAASAAIKPAAASLGVDVVGLELTRLDVSASQTNAVYKRMIAARQQQAAQERAQGAGEAEQIKADADRRQQALLADAYAKAQEIKGEGDAKAASIAAAAYGRDPQFYQFYQSMQAYRQSFKPNDVIVVDSSSDFFRFMRSPSGGGSAPESSAPARKH